MLTRDLQKVVLRLISSTTWTNFFNELYAGGEVHPKVNEHPLDALLLVLFLLQHKHVVVEKLLQFLVGEIDTQLFQAVKLQIKPGIALPHYPWYI